MQADRLQGSCQAIWAVFGARFENSFTVEPTMPVTCGGRGDAIGQLRRSTHRGASAWPLASAEIRCGCPAPDLRHHGVHFARLDVGDVHVDAAARGCASSWPSADGHRWRLMRASCALVVAERGLDHQVRHVHVAQALPQRRVGPGVAGEDPPAGARLPSTREAAPPARCARRGSTSIVLPPSSSVWPTRDRHRAPAPAARRSAGG